MSEGVTGRYLLAKDVHRLVELLPQLVQVSEGPPEPVGHDQFQSANVPQSTTSSLVRGTHGSGLKGTPAGLISRQSSKPLLSP